MRWCSHLDEPPQVDVPGLGEEGGVVGREAGEAARVGALQVVEQASHVVVPGEARPIPHILTVRQFCQLLV